MRSTVILATVAALLAVSAHTQVQAQPPVYSAEYAGPGQSAAVNVYGVVIGNDSTVYPGQPWVNDGFGVQDLPLLPGVVAARVSDINDSGKIVGTVYADGELTSDRPALWTPNNTGGYDVELLPLAGSATRGTAVAINKGGQILVSGFMVDGVLPTYRAYVIDNGATVPLGLANPITINDKGIVLTNDTLFHYPSMTDLGMPAPPDGLRAIALYPSDLNDNNEVAITMLTTIIGHTRYQAIGVYAIDVERWEMITDIVTNISSGPMNDMGDIVINGGPCNAMVYLSGLGFYCPDSLLDPDDTQWTLGRALAIADDRATLLAYGSNAVTGDAGTVRMTEAGELPLPAAPINVAAIPHAPTAQQNFVSIDVSWAPADGLTQSYIVERQGPGDTAFVRVASTTNRFYRDMSIISGENYDYRILAVGLAGTSAPSAVVSAVAPAQGDTEPPVIVPSQILVPPREAPPEQVVSPVEFQPATRRRSGARRSLPHRHR